MILRGCIQKFPDWVDNEINNNKHSLRSNTKGYGSKTHYSDSQNSDTTAPSAVLAPGGQSRNFWIHPRILKALISTEEYFWGTLPNQGSHF
jgi:hypothetical protein